MYASVLKATLEEIEKYHNKALEWYFHSLKFKRGSDEWLICRLKYQIYSRKAATYTKKLWMN
jgi:hypothetical protein